jgi:HK97 family phage portal protein
VYERQFGKNGRAIHKVAYNHDLYDVIHVEPNAEMSRFTFLKAYMAHVLAWGNGFAELQRNASTEITAIWPRNPAKTRPVRRAHKTILEPVPWRPYPVTIPAGGICFLTTDGLEDEDGSDPEGEIRSSRLIAPEDMLHIPGLALDGRVGQDVVWLARQTIGLALATEKFGAKYFANFARPGGMLIMPAVVSAEAKEQAKRSWMESQGGENSQRVAVMPPGFDFKPISNKPDESQTIETRKYVRNEICSIFHVPPHMVGSEERGRNNTEQMSQEFIQYTLAQWISAIKQEWKRKLFPNTGRGRTPKNRFFVDFDLTDMLRPDAASREKFYATGRQWGFLNANDCRAMEKLNPIEDEAGEDYWMPINMTLSDTPLDPNNQDGDGDGDKAKLGKKKKAEPLAKRYHRIFRDCYGRLCNREKRSYADVASIFGPVLFSIRDLLFDECCRQLRLAGKPGASTDGWLGDYMRRMATRAADWKSEDADQTCFHELISFLSEIRPAIFAEASGLADSETDPEPEPAAA